MTPDNKQKNDKGQSGSVSLDVPQFVEGGRMFSY